jgi:hypothetical protein
MINIQAKDYAVKVKTLVDVASNNMPEDIPSEITYALSEISNLSTEFIDGEEKKEEVISKVRVTYPNKELYYLNTIYSGEFVLTPQDINNVKRVNKETTEFTKKEIAKHGDYNTLRDSEAGIQILREIDASAGDLNNQLILEDCVLYPEDFKTKLLAGDIKSGLYMLLLDKISEISEWTDVNIEKV